jgi:hypothetical protein
MSLERDLAMKILLITCGNFDANEAANIFDDEILDPNVK